MARSILSSKIQFLMEVKEYTPKSHPKDLNPSTVSTKQQTLISAQSPVFSKRLDSAARTFLPRILFSPVAELELFLVHGAI